MPARRFKGGVPQRQTLCYAAYLLKHRDGERSVIEPSAVVSLLPISFGYDIPWMCEAYMDRELLRRTYQHLSALIGEGPSQDPDTSFKWHAVHFKYLLLTMLEDDRLTRMDLLRHDEVPPSSLAMTARCRRITCGRSTRALCPTSDATTRACSRR